MSSESRYGPERDQLAIRLEPGNVSVSFLSSLLRVVQATLREVARSEEDTRREFDQRPQPMLLLSRLVADSELTLHVVFVDPTGSTPLRELSAQTFDAFLDRFSEFVKGLPQPGLWGGARIQSRGRPESGLAKRMDQLYRELRRSPKVTMRFKGRSIEIEGDRMEIV